MDKISFNNIGMVQFNVIHIKFTKLADAPDHLVNCLKKYKSSYFNNIILLHFDLNISIEEFLIEVEKYLVNNKTNIIHYHNLYLDISILKIKYLIRTIIQYHSEPTRVSLKAPVDIKLVLNQYHMTLPEYKDCVIIQNIIDYNNKVYTHDYNINNDRIRIGYSPSILHSENKYYDKGFFETNKILELLRTNFPDIVEYDIIYNVSLEECISRKSICNIIIDECKTGSFHRSGLEGLALGKTSIAYLSPELEQSSKKFFNSDIPFINTQLKNLYNTLSKLIHNPYKIKEIGTKNKDWFLKYYNINNILNRYIDIYQKITL